MREAGAGENDLLARLSADARLRLSREALDHVLAHPIELVGAARTQTARFVAEVEQRLSSHPGARRYEPDPML
jgi:hypothetical protein